MTRRVEAVLARDLLLQLSDLGREKFDGGTALCAHHVMVVPTVELVFIPRDAIMKSHFACQATLRQQLQRAIDGGKSDLGVFAPDQPEELVRGQVVTGFEERAQNGVSLVRVFQSDPLQVFVENLLSFAHGFTRGWGMIVNPSLEHCRVGGGLISASNEIEIHFQLYAEAALLLVKFCSCPEQSKDCSRALVPLQSTADGHLHRRCFRHPA